MQRLVTALVFLACTNPSGALGQSKQRVIHVFVALADNEHQGIVPVPKALGNGDDPARNLYWGAAFGVKTFFKREPEWAVRVDSRGPKDSILERVIFENRKNNIAVVADAYRGSEIKQTLTDFFQAAAGVPKREKPYPMVIVGTVFAVPDEPDLVAYVGHDGLMDFPLTVDFSGKSSTNRSAIVLACASRTFFKDLLKQSGATPLLWTNGLMAPEAYTLKAALDGWIARESNEQIRKRAAEAYAKYQKISDKAALRLFAADW